MEKLDAIALQQELKGLLGWSLVGGEIVRVFEFADFVTAMRFVNQAADAAEEAGHHPDLDIRYNRVKVALVTHDSGGVTGKDIDLATRLQTSGAALGAGANVS